MPSRRPVAASSDRPTLTEEGARTLLKTWNTLNEKLTSLSEADLNYLLDLELKGKNRPYMLTRLIRRRARVRGQREEQEILRSR